MPSDAYDDAGEIDALVLEIRQAARNLAARPSSDRVRPIVATAIEAIARRRENIAEPEQAALADATMTLLAASAASMQAIGVCRVEEPFADLYEVIDPDGHGGYVRRLCCTHETQHCVTG
jgi:hypothetical protein